MATKDDSDPSLDWETEGGATLADGTVTIDLEADTAPHDLEALPGYEVGFRAGTERKAKTCYEEGQLDIRGALRSVLLMRGLNNEETAHLVEAVWRERTRL